MLQHFSFHFALRKGHPLQRNAHKLKVLEIRQPLCPCTDWSAGLRSRRNPFFQILGCVGDSTCPVGAQQPVELIGKGKSQCKAKSSRVLLVSGSIEFAIRILPNSSSRWPDRVTKGLLVEVTAKKNGMARANRPVGLTASAPHWYCATVMELKFRQHQE